MQKDEQHQQLIPANVIRRWIYMAVGILAAYFLISRPVLNFQPDTGILYVRSFEMVNQEQIVVTQTRISDGSMEIMATMPVKGLHYCSVAMLWGCILCLLSFFSKRCRIFIATVTEVIAGLFYILLIIYALRIADLEYATLYPNFFAFLPAVVLESMALVRRNLIRERADEADEEALIL